MGRRSNREDSWEEEDDFYDDDLDSPEDDLDTDGEDETIECPYCGKSIHEESQRCPYCENYLSDEDAPAQRKPIWIVLGVILCLLLVYSWHRWF